MLAKGIDEGDADSNLIACFAERLVKQSRSGAGFNSFQILYDVANNLIYSSSSILLMRTIPRQIN